jgi:L-asparaginase II
MSVKLVEMYRSGIIESTHDGSIVVAASDGSILHKLGDSGRLTFFHSSAKPIQGIAALELGIAEKFKLDLKEIALMISSHSGEQEHIEALNNLMDKLDVKEDMLECGIAEPVNKNVLKELFTAGKSISKLHCNCSGKHLGFIAASKLMGYPLESYYKLDHPIQKNVKKIIAEFACFEPGLISNGVDGCSVPVFALPLKNMAIAYANLCNPSFNKGKYAKSQNYITSSMTMFPEMVAGRGRIDTDLMKHFGSKIISKSGAEGVYCAGLPGKGIGIAVKIEDGSSRAVNPVVIELLVKMKVLNEQEAESLNEYWRTPVVNNKGEKTGEIKASFTI